MVQADLTVQAMELVSGIRTWCKSQVELWQQVPNLALEAEGRSGYLDQYSYCYHYGFWRIWAPDHRGSTVLLTSVDCASGELAVDVLFERKGLVLSSEADVLGLGAQLDDIDAAAIIEHLTEKAAQPVQDFIARSNPDWEAQKAEIRRNNGLAYGQPFQRLPATAT